MSIFVGFSVVDQKTFHFSVLLDISLAFQYVGHLCLDQVDKSIETVSKISKPYSHTMPAYVVHCGAANFDAYVEIGQQSR